MQPPLTLALIAALVGAVVTLAGSLVLGRLGLGRRVAGPVGLGAGLLAGWLVLAATGYALTLITLYLVFTGVVGVLGAATTRWRVPALAEMLGVGVAAAGLFVFEYRHGDMYALSSGLWWVACVVSVYALTFFGRGRTVPPAGEASDGVLEWAAERTLTVVALLGFAWYAVVAWRLPNPGLLTLSLLAVAVLAIHLLLPRRLGVRLGRAGVLGLAGLMFTLGLYAWMADASVPMAAAPVVLVAADVAFTLVARLASGRALAGGQRTVVGRVLGVLEPRDDLAWQRTAAGGGVRAANGLLLAGTVIAVALAAAEWYLLWASVPGVVPFVLLAAAYLAAAGGLARWARRRPAVEPPQSALQHPTRPAAQPAGQETAGRGATRAPETVGEP